MTTNGVRKIYIDSRWAAPGGRASNFVYELPQTVECGPNTVAYVTDVMIPMSWQTVTGLNNRLYVIEKNGSAYRRRILTVQAGQYNAQSLAAALQTAFDNPDTPALAGTYTVAYSTTTNKLSISNPGVTFYIVGSADLSSEAWYKSNWIGSFLGTPGPAYDTTAPNEINGLLGVTSPPGFYDSYSYANTASMGVVDIRNYASLFLHSEALSTYQSLAPGGSRNVIKRIPVTQGFGSVIQEGFSGCVWDFLDCSGLTLRSIDIRLRDARGNEIDLQGGHISFAVVFGSHP